MEESSSRVQNVCVETVPVDCAGYKEDGLFEGGTGGVPQNGFQVRNIVSVSTL